VGILHIAVVIRDTVDCQVLLPADSYGEKPLAEGQVKIINPSDWSALEQAIALKKQGVVQHITVLNVGQSDGEEALRWCLATGADAAQRLWDPALEDSDQLGKGKTLAAALERLKVNLVLCGDKCLDQLNSLIPGIAADAAGMTYLTEIEKVENIDNDKAVVIRRRPKGKREKVAVRLPALLAIAEVKSESSERAGIDDTLTALTQKIPCWDLGDLGLVAEMVGARGAKITNIQIRPAKPPFTKPQTPDYRLPAQQRLQAIITGGAVRKQGEVVTGEPDKLVEKIIEFLCQEPNKR